MTKCIISYSLKKDGKFIEHELMEYMNDGDSEYDGDTVVWTVELPKNVIERLMAAKHKGICVKEATISEYDKNSFLSDSFIAEFENGFEAGMPEDYVINEDKLADSSWCAPWTVGGEDWFRENMSPYDMGKAWAKKIVGEWEAWMADNGNRLTLEEEKNSEISFDGLTAKLPTRRNEYFHWYSNETKPQGAFLEINPYEKTFTVDWNPEIGNAVPEAVFSGRILCFGFPCTLPLNEVRSLVEDAAPYAARIVNGYSEEERNGSIVGVLNFDARKAAEAIEALCDGNPIPENSFRP